ncbi:MAG: hypothetical protein HY343_01370 [Lentisphaerae bacterium]|nr:hypothetical protein [Lentisphaerota bacterium]
MRKIYGSMTSRERMMAALRCQPADHVPCAPWIFNNTFPGRKSWNGQRERCEFYADTLGVDGWVDTYLNVGTTPGIKTEFWKTDNGQVLHKVFHTPSGDLSASLRVHEALKERDDIAIQSDLNPPLFIKPWIRTLEDVECFRHVCLPPTADMIERVRAEIPSAQSLADEFGYPLIGNIGHGLTWLTTLMKVEDALVASMDTPELIERFMDIEHAAGLARMEVMLDAGVQIILRNGFYETCEYWSPEQVKRFVLPRVNEEARQVHSKGGVLIYTVCTGILPLLDLYRDSEIDGFIKYETKLMGQTLAPIAAKLGGRKCLWGGISDCEDLGRGTPDGVRQAVRDLVAQAGRRGVIVGASPSIKPERPVENVMALFDEWRKIR